MTIPTPKHPIIAYLEKNLKEFWKEDLPKPVRVIFCLVFTILITLGSIFYVIILYQKIKAQGENEVFTDPKDNMVKEEKIEPTPTLLGISDCFTTNWEGFKEEDWSGVSWFSISNNVWTIRYPETEKDAAIFYNTCCVGGSLVEYQVIPLLEEFLNINVYQRGQLRWEIGGGDRRSIRLWKNTTGCATGEIKRSILLKEWYISGHDEILINQPLIIHSAIFYLSNGLIRSEVWLTYSSKIQNGGVITTPRGEYFYDFQVGSLCISTHFPDINLESYQTGIGLQSKKTVSETQDKNFPLPRVNFDKFRIVPFSNTD